MNTPTLGLHAKIVIQNLLVCKIITPYWLIGWPKALLSFMAARTEECLGVSLPRERRKRQSRAKRVGKSDLRTIYSYPALDVVFGEAGWGGTPALAFTANNTFLSNHLGLVPRDPHRGMDYKNSLTGKHFSHNLPPVHCTVLKRFLPTANIHLLDLAILKLRE